MQETRPKQIKELFKLPKLCQVEKLYRYRSMEAKELDGIFNNRQIYLPSPISFNDPFDCRPSITIHESRLKKDYYIRNMIKNQCKSASKREQKALIIKAKIEINDKAYQYYVYKEFLKTIGVYCLSEKKDDILMWSHYSRGHRGICLEFFANKEINLFGQAFKVYYCEEYPLVNTMDLINPEEVHKSLLTKSKHWEYEKEWRILKTNSVGGPGKHNFQPELLSGVIFGALISDEDKNRVLGWVSNYPTKINVYQAKISKTRYQLDIESI